MSAISLTSAPAAKTRSPPYTITARTSSRSAASARARADLLLHLDVERVHLRSVDPDRAHAVLDLEPYELAHRHLSSRRCRLSTPSLARSSGTMSRVTKLRVARQPPAPGCDVGRGEHQLRGVRPRGDLGRAVPVRRGRRRGGGDPLDADREDAGHLARRAARASRPGQRYGFRADGPWEPARGRMFNPAKLLLDPYARAISGTVVPDGPIYGYPRPDSRDLDEVRAAQRGPRSDVDSAPYVPRSVVVRDDFDWGDDDAGPAAAPVDRHDRLRAARQGVHRSCTRRCPRRSAGPTPG